LLFWSGVNGLLAVALGAFGAHSLKPLLEKNGTLETFQTGAHYHLVHAVALLGVALLAERLSEPKVARRTGNLFLGGIVFFSGSLYLLALTNVRVLGAVAPLGGLCFLGGWLSLVVASFREMPNQKGLG
jgi:uncharacterized membrane protein YgdD (TMEM256/DUF423 family)